MTYRFLCLPAFLTLFACNPATVYKPTEVAIPVESICQFNIPPEPQYLLPLVPADASLTIKVKAMISDLQTKADYIGKLLAAMEACNGSGNLQSPSGGRTAGATPALGSHS